VRASSNRGPKVVLIGSSAKPVSEPFGVGTVAALLEVSHLHGELAPRCREEVGSAHVFGLDRARQQRLGIANQMPLAGDHPPPDVVGVPLVGRSSPSQDAEVVAKHLSGGELK